MYYSEFVQWLAYYQVEPFGGLRGDIQSATIVAVLANIHRDRKKRGRAYRVAEFLPNWWQTGGTDLKRKFLAATAKLEHTGNTPTDDGQRPINDKSRDTHRRAHSGHR